MYDWTAQSHGLDNSLLKKSWRSSNPVDWNETLQAISMSNSHNFDVFGGKKREEKKAYQHSPICLQ